MAQQSQSVLFHKWAPLSATVLSYGRYLDPVPGFNFIETAGSSTTVTGVNSFRGTAEPFANFTAGTLLFKRTESGATDADINIVATVVSDNEITIVTAKDYTDGVGGWWHQIFLTGTETLDGWVIVQNARKKAVKIVVNNLANLGGVTYSVEGKGWNLDETATQLTTGSLLADTFPTNSIEIPILETVAALRVGLTTAAAAAPDAADQVSVFIIERIGPLEGEN
jgi:hypothetical protein